jgi:hypothetical protein
MASNSKLRTGWTTNEFGERQRKSENHAKHRNAHIDVQYSRSTVTVRRGIESVVSPIFKSSVVPSARFEQRCHGAVARFRFYCAGREKGHRGSFRQAAPARRIQGAGPL